MTPLSASRRPWASCSVKRSDAGLRDGIGREARRVGDALLRARVDDGGSGDRITGGRGAHVAFDPVGGPEVAKILEALGYLGIFFQYGALDTAPLAVPVMPLLGKDLTVRGYQLFEITKDPARLEKAKAFIVKGLASGVLKPVVAKIFKLDQIVEAHRFMESNEQVGKIVVMV